MRGKEKCKALKEIRRQIAQQNDIEYVVSECSYQGECKGTCPKCEAELRYLERELAVRQGLGRAVAVVGISASVCTGLTACNPAEAAEEFFRKIGNAEETAGVLPAPETLEGDIAMPEPAETPMPEAVDGMLEVPTEQLTPLPDVLEGAVVVVETPLPEVLEGDVEVAVTPIPSVKGEIMPALDEGEQEEILMGEIYIPVEEQE